MNKPIKPKKQARPGMLVEDRNVAVRTNDDGSQALVKVPSRADEAKRQGVQESSI